jgi:membrane protein insertase Oxa1/YidC/SpoIIIJ
MRPESIDERGKLAELADKFRLMIVLRQGRAIPSSIAQHGHSALYELSFKSVLMCSPLGALRNAPLSSIRYFSLRPAWRAPPPSPFMFKRKSVSGFSTLTVHRHPLGKTQIGISIFGTFRPQIQFSKTPRLTASLSTGAQRLLDESQEWARDLPSEISDIGDMAQLGLGLTNWPSDLMIRFLEFCHVNTELPWWGSIVLLTLILRVALFPLMLKTTRNTAIVPYIKDKQIELINAAKEARESGELVEVRKATMKLMDLYKEWGYRPLLGFIGLLQLPIFIGVFRTLSRCSELPVPGWQTGGTAWFTDLTAIDPYFILPTVSGLTTAGTILVYSRCFGN